MTMILEDGFSTIIEFALEASVKFAEIEVTPPGVTAGGAIPQTTMRNTEWRTKAPKKLKDMSDGSLVVAYDPAVLPQIVAMTGKNQLITITYPDGDTVAFYGWIDEFTPGAHVEGERPTADVTIIASLRHSTTGAETAPVHTPVPAEP